METLDFVTQIELEELLSKFAKNIETSEDEERLIFYVYDELYKKHKFEPSTEDIQQRMKDLCNGYVLRTLTEKGILEPYFDPDGDEDVFEVTEFGNRVYERLVNE